MTRKRRISLDYTDISPKNKYRYHRILKIIIGVHILSIIVDAISCACNHSLLIITSTSGHAYFSIAEHLSRIIYTIYAPLTGMLISKPASHREKNLPVASRLNEDIINRFDYDIIAMKFSPYHDCHDYSVSMKPGSTAGRDNEAGIVLKEGKQKKYVYLNNESVFDL